MLMAAEEVFAKPMKRDLELTAVPVTKSQATSKAVYKGIHDALVKTYGLSSPKFIKSLDFAFGMLPSGVPVTLRVDKPVTFARNLADALPGNVDIKLKNRAITITEKNAIAQNVDCYISASTTSAFVGLRLRFQM